MHCIAVFVDNHYLLQHIRSENWPSVNFTTWRPDQYPRDKKYPRDTICRCWTDLHDSIKPGRVTPEAYVILEGLGA